MVSSELSRLDKFYQLFRISPQQVRLALIFFLVTFLSRGMVLTRGLSVDDYRLEPIPTSVFYSHGRFLAAWINSAVDFLGTQNTDLYFVLGLATICLCSLLIMSILRFLNATTIPGVAILGALMVSHPYGTEIFTYRNALSIYCPALLFSILVLELISQNPTRWQYLLSAFFASLAMLCTYQIFLNYLLVVALFSWLFGEMCIVDSKIPDTIRQRTIYRQRARGLAMVCFSSIIVFVMIFWVIRRMGLPKIDVRSQLITLAMIPNRIDQAIEQWIKIFWAAEPILPKGLKYLLAILLLLSFLNILYSYWAGNFGKIRLWSFSLFLLTLLSLAPLSLGIILPFQNWWPVPRTISHVAVLLGLFFLLAIFHKGIFRNHAIRIAYTAGLWVLMFSFILMDNQILADQQRINELDRLTALRLIARLEDCPGFQGVQFLHIEGGRWDYPTALRTMNGDMNISALYPNWSKVRLLNMISGYNWQQAEGARKDRGQLYCAGTPPWPAVGSVQVESDLAILCLPKN